MSIWFCSCRLIGLGIVLVAAISCNLTSACDKMFHNEINFCDHFFELLAGDTPEKAFALIKTDISIEPEGQEYLVLAARDVVGGKRKVVSCRSFRGASNKGINQTLQLMLEWETSGEPCVGMIALDSAGDKKSVKAIQVEKVPSNLRDTHALSLASMGLSH